MVDIFLRRCYHDGMALKEEIYNLLDAQRGTYFSGEELAKRFGVSRNAVWKAVKSLEKEGFVLSGVNNRGYSLLPENDLLTAGGIRKYLSFLCDIRVEKCIPSTNDALKAMAREGAPEWTVLLAEEQTAGKGRYRRRFYSPRGAGLYMSILLRPSFPASETLFITTGAAVAVCEAVESVSKKHGEIKWVNDVFTEGKKICGILTEASFNVESGGLDYAVVGIGINVLETAFPEELSSVATSVFAGESYPPEGRARLAASLLERFRYYYEHIPERAFYAPYKNRLFILGRKVQVVSGDVQGEAEVLDLDENCFLKVRFSDGRERLLSAGEISIKLQG